MRVFKWPEAGIMLNPNWASSGTFLSKIAICAPVSDFPQAAMGEVAVPRLRAVSQA
jgi:hypothetical protein